MRDFKKKGKRKSAELMEYLCKEFNVVSETNLQRSTNAAVTQKELHLTKELNNAKLEKKNLRRTYNYIFRK